MVERAASKESAGGNSVLRRRWPLFALCGGLALVEAIALQVTGFRSAMPLAPQISAPASLGVYHDLRWVFPYSWSWTSTIWQLAALLAFRTLVTAAIVVLAWPAGTPRESWPVLLRRNLVATAVAVVALSPWVAVAFAAQAVAYSWFMLLSIVAAFVTVLVLPLAVTGRWWRRLVLWRSAGWVALAALALTVEALVISVAPGWVAVLAAFAAGLLNAVIWLGLVRVGVHAGEPAHPRPLAPVAMLTVLAVFLVGGGFLVSSAVGDHRQRPSGPAPVPGGQPVLFVAGYNTAFDGGPFALFSSTELASWHYSYQGLGPAGPLPYEPIWTHQAVDVSAAKLAAQVDWLAARTGRPVAVVAESEGTLVARAYLTANPAAPVSSFVMASPLPRPGRVYYPPAGETGWGWLGGWEVRGLLAMLRLLNPGFEVSADMPLVRSVVENAGLFRPSILCPVGGGVQTFAFVPLSGATVVYHGEVSHVPWTALPGWHASLLPRETVARDIEQLLTTGRVSAHDVSTTAFRLIYGAAAAWQVPALPLHLRAEWNAPPNTDPAFARWHCPTYWAARRTGLPDVLGC
ncbi:MAG: hypothetical protein L0H64_23350, partial [Pseudonocardia sp.]|nr:hypothetical protein [Pseudonocardia sp.]